jgi:hypothetical protein
VTDGSPLPVAPVGPSEPRGPGAPAACRNGLAPVPRPGRRSRRSAQTAEGASHPAGPEDGPGRGQAPGPAPHVTTSCTSSGSTRCSSSCRARTTTCHPAGTPRRRGADVEPRDGPPVRHPEHPRRRGELHRALHAHRPLRGAPPGRAVAGGGRGRHASDGEGTVGLHLVVERFEAPRWEWSPTTRVPGRLRRAGPTPGRCSTKRGRAPAWSQRRGTCTTS